MKKKYYYIVGAIILAGAIFYGGMILGKSQAGGTLSAASLQNMTPQQQQQLFQQLRSSGGFTRSGNFTPGAGGGSSGQIISTDAQGMTIKLRSGSSQIVIIPASAAITMVKPQNATTADLKQGLDVTVMGTTNADGSITAQTIQIRQMSPQQPSGNQPAPQN